MTAEGSDTAAQAFLQSYPDIEAIEVLQPDMLGVLRGKRLSPVVKAHYGAACAAWAMGHAAWGRARPGFVVWYTG